jgi:hypothetical protein
MRLRLRFSKAGVFEWRRELASLIHDPSRQSFVDPALRFGDLGARQFPVAQAVARFRVFAVLRGWA